MFKRISSKKTLLYLPFIFLFNLNFLSAQEFNIFELMERQDLTLPQIEAIANQHFAKVGKERGSGYKQFQRWLYEKKFHVREDGTLIDAETEWNAYLAAKRNLKSDESGFRSMAPSAWTELGPKSWTATSGWNPGVGRLTSVAIHPSNEAIIYVSSPGGGIWKSINSGSTWTPLIDNVNSSWMNIYNLCIDPSNVNTIYAGLSSGGVLKSTDAGATWATTGSGPSTIRKILVHPTNSSIVFAASSAGLYRSTNAGTSWTLVQSGSFQDIELKPDNPNIVYASTSSSSSYRSIDNGATWSLITLAGSGRTLIGVSPADANVVYMVQASGSIFGAFYRSTDAGLTYTTMITGSSGVNNFFGYNTDGSGTSGQATYDMGICVNRTNINEVHIAGIICFKTINGGTSFVPETAWSYPNSTGYNHADVHGLEWVNNNIYSVSDGGVYKSTNNGDDWTDLSSGLGIRQFYKIACAKTDANLITGGAQDNGSTYRQANGTWREWLGADGMDGIISPTNASIAIGTSQNGSIYKTTNAGASYSGLSNPSSGAWVTPLVMHPTNHDTVYGGWTGIYRSVNGGTSWTLLTGSLINSTMTCLEVAKNTRYIYGSIGSTLYRTSDAGATWTSVSAPGTITSICASPLNPQKIWVTTSSSSNNVQVSTNMGTSWTNISTGLPTISARSIVVDNTTNEGLYVGMNIGVYYRDNVNTAWITHGTGLPLVAINEVELQLSSKKVRIATYGRGVWENGMQDPPSVYAGADVTVTCASPSTTLTAINGVSYVWSNGATTASTTVSPNTTTTYTVTATMSGGNTTTDVVVVSVNKAAPTVSAGADATVTCANPSTTLNATGLAGTFLWSNGTTTASNSVGPLVTTTYTVTLTANSNGCTASDDVLVTSIKQSPTINAGADVTTTCINQNAILTAIGNGTFLWSTGATTTSITVSPSFGTTYTVTLTDATGCTNTDNVFVGVNKTAPLANAGADVTISNGLSTTLVASGGISYLWNNGVNTSSNTVSPVVTTTYTVTVTGSNGCTAADPVTVTVQAITGLCANLSFVAPKIQNNKFRTTLRMSACNGNFGIGNNNLRLNFNKNALTNPVIISENFLSPDFGTTTTTGTILSNGVISLNTSYSGATNSNVLPISSTGIDLVVLEFDIINSTQTSGLSWRISGANPKTTIVDDDKVTAILNIVGTGLDISLEGVSLGPDITLNCTNTTAIITAVGSSNYVWSNAATTTSINVSPTITTTYSVTASNGATDDIIVMVDKNPPIVNAGADATVTCNNPIAVLTASGGVSYIWNTSETTATINVSPTFTTTYIVTATGANTCQASDEVVVYYQLCSPVLQAKVFLNHADNTSLLMENYLSTLNNFPLSDPYTSVPLNTQFTHVNNSQIATTTPIVLSATGDNAIVDWMFVELRSGTSGATSVAYTKSGLLQRDGDIVATDGISPLTFNNALAGNYYIAVRHRNHLGLRTINSYNLSGTPTVLNFTNNSVPIYGASPVVSLGNNVFALNSGDSNSDGSIDAFDTILWEIQNGLFDDYTNNSDYNSDGSVDAFDTILWELNNGKFQDLD